MREQAPVRSSHHSLHQVHLPSSLAAASQVYVRYDTVRRPLQWPYDGPFTVLRKGDKTFDILRQDRTVTVSIDRLLFCFLLHPPGPLFRQPFLRRLRALRRLFGRRLLSLPPHLSLIHI